jgi:hypothetical protein
MKVLLLHCCFVLPGHEGEGEEVDAGPRGFERPVRRQEVRVQVQVLKQCILPLIVCLQLGIYFLECVLLRAAELLNLWF